MDQIITTITGALTSFVTGSATAISGGLETLLFTTGTDGAISGLTAAGTTIFTMFAIGAGVGLMSVIFALIRHKG